MFLFKNKASNLAVSFLFLICCAFSANAASVLTQHNDLARTGANLAETALTAANVNSTQFGKLFTRVVDGQIYAQILYAPSLPIPGKGVVNVIFAVTEHNSVYAFDADSPAAAQPLWHVNVGTPILCTQIPYCNRDLVPEIGITSTPVIDPATNTIFLVAETYESGVAVFRLHALDCLTGAQRPNSPVVISGSVPSTGPASKNGVLTFAPLMHWQRTGLLLSNHSVYAGFGSHQDTPPYQGWMIGYDISTLQQTVVRSLSPNGNAGIWQGGGAPAVDTAGNVYLQTGHGILSGLAGGDFGISMVKLRAGDLVPLDYFSPSNQQALSDDDNDFGSSNPLLIPGTAYAVGGGKDGKLFLVDTANMGQFDPLENHVPQYWQATYSMHDTGAGGIFGGNVWYNNMLYMWGRRDVLKAFLWNGTQFLTTPASTSTFAVPDGYSSEPALAISANGSTPGTGILWAVTPNYGSSDGHNYPGTIHAFDASDVSRELWNSNQVPSRDTLGSWSKWVAPTVVNGKVYVATFDGAIQAYGIMPGSAQLKLVSLTTAATPVNLTSEGSADWVHWGDTSPSRKAGVAPQISDAQILLPQGRPYTVDLRAVSWTDGTPVPAATGNTNAYAVVGINNGYKISAPADQQARVIRIHVGGALGAGQLVAHLSDSSAPDYVDAPAPFAAQYDRDYTLQYQAATPGQTLQISWTLTTRTGAVSLNSISLATGQLTGTSAVGYAADLTSEGTIDWIHWGETPLNRKALTTPVLGSVAFLSASPAYFYNNDLRTLSWADGAPAAANTGSRNGIYINGTGSGYSLTIPADAVNRVVRLHAGGYASAARLTATLSDGSAAPWIDDTPNAGGQFVRDYTLTFHSALPGQTLTLTWAMTSGSGNVTLNGLSLGSK